MDTTSNELSQLLLTVTLGNENYFPTKIRQLRLKEDEVTCPVTCRSMFLGKKRQTDLFFSTLNEV